MVVVGLRELRQQASDIVRRVEAGEEVTITVAGRPSVRIVPAAPRTWRSYSAIAELFAGRADPDWEDDRDTLDDALRGQRSRRGSKASGPTGCAG